MEAEIAVLQGRRVDDAPAGSSRLVGARWSVVCVWVDVEDPGDHASVSAALTDARLLACQIVALSCDVPLADEVVRLVV